MAAVDDEKFEFFTVEDVAEKLGASVATVRRKCANGEWGAIKAGRQWLVPAEEFAGIKASPQSRTRRQRSAQDFETALRYIRTTDMSEMWVPDVLRYRDRLDNPKKYLARAIENTTNGNYSAAVRLPVPKTVHASRPGVLIGIEDRIAYQAVVGSFAELVNSRLSDRVSSCRLSSHNKYFLEHGTRRYARFLRTVRSEAKKKNGWVVKTDITSYFEHVSHRLLFSELESAGVSASTLGSLRSMLKSWALVDGIGLPQGPNASRVLGNFYLFNVDSEMLDAGFDYYRYMDDFRILADGKANAVAGLRKLEELCRRRGLSLSSAKTEIVEADRYVEEDDDKLLQRASYFFDRRDLSRARLSLKELLRSALPAHGVVLRRVKFSMWRLALIREVSVLSLTLKNLERLAPVASIVAAYLKNFINRRAVQQKLADFMADATIAYSDYLRVWIFAGMLESKTVPEAWRRIARTQVEDRNSPPYLRAVASCVMAKRREARDIHWIRSELEGEHNPTLIRGYLTALKYGGALDRSVSDLPSIDDDGRETIEWLKGRSALPSLVYSDRTIVVPTR